MNIRKPLIAALAAVGFGIAALLSTAAAAEQPSRGKGKAAQGKDEGDKPAEVGTSEGKKIRDIARPGREKPGGKGAPEGRGPQGRKCKCGYYDKDKPCPYLAGKGKRCPCAEEGDGKPCPCAKDDGTCGCGPDGDGLRPCERDGKSEGKRKAEDDGVENLEKLGLRSAKKEARLEALKKRVEEMKKTHNERRAAARERITKRLGTATAQPAVRAELRLHAMRVARLTRIRELAAVEGKAKVEDRAIKALERENRRHEKRMEALAPGKTEAAPSANPVAPAAPAAPGAPAATETKGGAQ